ncbi:unnamed protein product [Peronospora farinosa]|uniref:Uncharacterized protein n=1 Tax=Peronospora farinosa TaxID=134698 RepID=A0ABN8C4N2_9STRA|nr:unnamed protein product [Peronospora farinosa]
MESIYGLGRLNMLCAYVSCGTYIQFRVVHKQPRTVPFEAIERAQITIDIFRSVPTSDYRTARQLAEWWDEWKIRLRKVFVATTKIARQSLTRSYRQRLKCLYVRLDAALSEAHSSAKSIACAQVICDQPSPVDNHAELRRNVSERRRLWQRTKKERLLVQHTYSPGETSRSFFARVSSKFQDNTIVSFSGQTTYGSKRSQEFADEMADGWGHLMTKFFDRPDATTAFLERESPPVRIGGLSMPCIRTK